jgi:hypothetical protein
MGLVPPPEGSTRAAVDSVAVQVTPENVLQARAALLRNAERINDHLQTIRGEGWHMIGLCGGDPISEQAQVAFARKIQDHAIQPAKQYVAELLSGAERLARVARSYGIAEQRITESFSPSGQGVDPR